MLEGISKNWGHLTTISAIAAAAFGAGIWMKSSLDALENLPKDVKAMNQRLESLKDIPKDMDALESLPEEVEAMDQRLRALESLPNSIKQSTESTSQRFDQSDCVTKAEIKKAKFEVLEEHFEHQKQEIRDRAMILWGLKENWTDEQKLEHESLQTSEMKLEKKLQENRGKKEEQEEKLGDCE